MTESTPLLAKMPVALTNARRFVVGLGLLLLVVLVCHSCHRSL